MIRSRQTISFIAAAFATSAFLSLASAQTKTAKEIAHTLLPAVVKLEVADASGKIFATGSGFVVRSDGVVFTNFHVIDGASEAQALLSNGDRVRVLGAIDVDPQRDFAILKLEAVDLPVIPVGNSDSIEPGEDVVALGAPLGLSGSVSTGTVSQLREMDGRRVIQHTSPISHGSSGGPLITLDGKAIGLNTFLLEKGNSLFFAIPVNYPRAALENSPGKWVSLAQLDKTVSAARQQQQAAEQEESIRKNFVAYQDPGGLVSLVVPRTWRSDRTEYDEPGGGAHHVMLMFSSPAAEKASLNGWLSKGIRLHFRFPLQGHEWSSVEKNQWTEQQFQGLQAGYRDAKVSKRSSIEISKVPAFEQMVAGGSSEVSKSEISVLEVLPDSRCLVTIEIVSPDDEQDQLGLVRDVVNKTLVLNLHQ